MIVACANRWPSYQFYRLVVARMVNKWFRHGNCCCLMQYGARQPCLRNWNNSYATQLILILNEHRICWAICLRYIVIVELTDVLNSPNPSCTTAHRSLSLTTNGHSILKPELFNKTCIRCVIRLLGVSVWMSKLCDRCLLNVYSLAVCVSAWCKFPLFNCIQYIY